MMLSGKKSAKNYLKWLSSRKDAVLNYLASLDDDERTELLGSFPETIVSVG